MRRLLPLTLLALALLVPGSAHAENPRLTATVGPGFTIGLTGAAGPVTKLDPGTYDVVVRDLSDEHNFHLFGPGVNESTSVAGTGTVTWTVTFRDGRYTFVCDPHPSAMRGGRVPDGEGAAHRRRVRVADERVAAVAERDGPGGRAGTGDIRRAVDAGAEEVEVVLVGQVADRDVVRAGFDLRDGCAGRVCE